MIENGEVVKCPICGSENVEPVYPFDYIKMCMNDDCKYHIEHSQHWRNQFVT